MERLLNGLQDCPNQHENSHKLYDETGNPVLSLTKSQWKLRQQLDQNVPMEGTKCRATTSIRTKKQIQKSRAVKVAVRDLRRKVNHLSKVI